jgi:hypothetical protein
MTSSNRLAHRNKTITMQISSETVTEAQAVRCITNLMNSSKSPMAFVCGWGSIMERIELIEISLILIVLR